MSMKISRKPDTEKWERRELGASAAHAVASAPEKNEAVDSALGLQLISIRLQSDLIEELREIAREEGLGYQPLIRNVLTRFAKERKMSKGRKPSRSRKSR